MFGGGGNGVAMPPACDCVIGWAITNEMGRGWGDRPVRDKLVLRGRFAMLGACPSGAECCSAGAGVA